MYPTYSSIYLKIRSLKHDSAVDLSAAIANFIAIVDPCSGIREELVHMEALYQLMLLSVRLSMCKNF